MTRRNQTEWSDGFGLALDDAPGAGDTVVGLLLHTAADGASPA